MVTCVALGEIIRQRTVVQRLLAGALEPCHVIGILHALQQFFVVLDGMMTETVLPLRVTISVRQRCVHGVVYHSSRRFRKRLRERHGFEHGLLLFTVS